MSGILARLWDQRCPIVETGTRCVRESPVDRFSVLPLLGGLTVGGLGGGTIAFGVFSVAVKALERSVVVEEEGELEPLCPIQSSIANALCDVAVGALGWWVGSWLYEQRHAKGERR